MIKLIYKNGNFEFDRQLVINYEIEVNAHNYSNDYKVYYRLKINFIIGVEIENLTINISKESLIQFLEYIDKTIEDKKSTRLILHSVD